MCTSQKFLQVCITTLLISTIYDDVTSSPLQQQNYQSIAKHLIPYKLASRLADYVRSKKRELALRQETLDKQDRGENNDAEEIEEETDKEEKDDIFNSGKEKLEIIIDDSRDDYHGLISSEQEVIGRENPSKEATVEEDTSESEASEIKTSIDMDDLIEKIKDRLLDELKAQNYSQLRSFMEETAKKEVEKSKISKLIMDNLASTKTSLNMREYQSDSDQDTKNVDYVKDNPRITKMLEEKTTKGYKTYVAKKEIQAYQNDLKNVETTIYDESSTSNMFQAVPLGKHKAKDSYEDYEIPKKENIYASEESEAKRLKSVFPKHDFTTKPPKQDLIERPIKSPIKPIRQQVKIPVARLNRPKTQDPSASDETKSRTEKMVWEYDDNNELLISEKEKHFIKSNTMVPTKRRYHGSTPNYYIKTPKAEKYNFDEDIPEADREQMKPVTFDPIVNINGKHKVSGKHRVIMRSTRGDKRFFRANSE